MAVGRISGPLLKSNLLRDGVDLAFETDLLYLDVNPAHNGRIGIKTATPTHDLTVNGTTRTAYLEATTSAQLSDLMIIGNTISSSSNTINLLPGGSNAVVYQGTIIVDDITINGNTIQTTGVGTNLEITTAGSGKVNLNSNVLVNGSLHATGNITADGDINLGNETTDTINFGGEIVSDILPKTTNTYTLGSPSLRWAGIYTDTVNATTINGTNITATDFKTSQLEIYDNTIQAIPSNTDIRFVTSGTGGVVFGNLKFSSNTITNISPNATTEFVESGTGYVKLSGTNGVVIPFGDSNQRPPLAYQETGMIRFNTELQLVEVFDGTAWNSVAGASAGVTATTAQDIGIEVVLLLG